MRRIQNRTGVALILTMIMVIFFQSCAEPIRSRKYFINGLTLIINQIPETEVITVGFFLKGGVAFMPEEQMGIEQLLLKVAPKGTENYDKETLQRLTESMGTQISGRANRDVSALTLRCLKDKFDPSWDIFQDVISNPLFDTTEINLEREKQLTAIRSEKDTPDSYLNKIAREYYFKGHPYEFSPLGTVATVTSLTRDDFVNYHKEYITKSRALVVVAGDVELQDIRDKVRELALSLPRGRSFMTELPKTWKKVGPGIKVVKSETPIPTNYIIGLTSAPNRLSRDYYPFILGMRVLRYRVFEEVRTKRNLSYAPSAAHKSNFVNTSYLYVTTTKPDTTIKVMFAEVDRLKNESLTDKELHDQLMVFLTRHYRAEETVSARVWSLAVNELFGRGYGAVEKFMYHLENVTPEDVQRVANTYLNNYQFAILGDPDAVDKQVFLSY